MTSIEDEMMPIFTQDYEISGTFKNFSKSMFHKGGR